MGSLFFIISFREWASRNDGFGRDRSSYIVPSSRQCPDKALAPETKWFVNDYNVIEGGDTAEYVRSIRSLLDQGTPIGGIGAQGHFFAPINPVDLGLRLDQLAAFGLPVWITEYDYAAASESDRADSLETALRVAYSKPAVHGFILWGFWAGAHWRGATAALVDSDFSINAAGRRYQALRSEWTTTADGTTDENGHWSFRGFHGEYEVTMVGPGGESIVRWFRILPGAGEQQSVLSLADLPLPRFQVATPLEKTVSLAWDPLVGAIGCQLQSSPDLREWTALSPVMSPLSRAWIDRRPPVDPARFFRVIATDTIPVTFDLDFNGSEGGTSTYTIDASGKSTTLQGGPIHQTYYWFASPDLRNGTYVLTEDTTIPSPGGGPAGVLNFQIAVRPTLKAGGADYWGFILPGFNLTGLPLGSVVAADLSRVQLQFRYRLASGKQMNVRLEPTAAGGGFASRCDFGNLTGNGAWKTFALKLSQGSNLTAFRNFINDKKSGALQLTFGNGAGLSSYSPGDVLQLDDILLGEAQ